MNLTAPTQSCDICKRPTRADLSGLRCHDCRLVHGHANPTNPHLVRVEAVSPIVNAAMTGADRGMEEIPAG